jgi:asparaginyl-tRNA synthetase
MEYWIKDGDILSERMIEIVRIRASVLRFIRRWLDKNGYLEVPTPVIVKDPIEKELAFKLNYFGQDAFISHNSQLYLENIALSIGNAWTSNPSFRSEKHESDRHLSEFILFQLEKVDIKDLDEILHVQEDLICQVIETVLYEQIDSFNFLKLDISYLKNIKPHFERMSYDEAIRNLKSREFKVEKNRTIRSIEWGDDLDINAESELTRDKTSPIFITHFPMKIRPFYIMRDRGDEEKSVSVDLLAPKGFGELTSGGLREDSVHNLENELKKRYNNDRMFEWYCRAKITKMPTHGGFGMGIDRLIRWLTNTQNIKDIMPFPRTPSINEP